MKGIFSGKRLFSIALHFHRRAMANSNDDKPQNPELMREEQVENAVKFLLRPKVRETPVMHRRSFLEKMGLTKEEIDEAFRRVPDPTPATTPTVVSDQYGQVKSSSNVQRQPPTQVQQLLAFSKMGMLSRFHWYHAILPVGVVAASGAGIVMLFKKSIVRRWKSWIRKVELEKEDEGQTNKSNIKPSPSEEAAAAATAYNVIQVCHKMLMKRSEENRCFEELIDEMKLMSYSLQDQLTTQMKLMSYLIEKLEVGQSMNRRIASEGQDDVHVSRNISNQPYANNRKTDTHLHSEGLLSPPVPEKPSAAHDPYSFAEIMNMIRNGNKPSNIMGIIDPHSPNPPPNPNRPVPDPRLEQRPKPQEGKGLTTQESNRSISDRRQRQNVLPLQLPWPYNNPRSSLHSELISEKGSENESNLEG